MHPRDSDNFELAGKESILAIERGSTRSHCEKLALEETVDLR